ncbi:hypothetical protein [Roseiconus nitratireducens]|uniref:hypothetical protein n=1 Tax=Roseiconus nitratireducens TaxID=2605748 RepID=UPI00191C2FFE|nr:hypothetical protein [Roseiconus nitratireducens]
MGRSQSWRTIVVVALMTADVCAQGPRRLPPVVRADADRRGLSERPVTPFEQPVFAELPTARLPLPPEFIAQPVAADPSDFRSVEPVVEHPPTGSDAGGFPCDGVPDVCFSDFSVTPLLDRCHIGGCAESWVYDAKSAVPTQSPWVQWGRVWYGDGITPRGIDWFGPYDLVRPKMYVYGDFRSGIQAGRNALGRADNWANRLNLDMDLQVTDTERFHAFVGPLDKQNRFTRYELVDGDLRYRNEMNLTPATAFIEGDLGVILGAAANQSSPFELPVTLGLVPLLFQNGIWMEDAVSGIAFALPAKHSRTLNWSNVDLSFFAVFDQLNSPAFAGKHDAQAFGTAWFIDAYGGYIESGYAYLNDRRDRSLSYHNVTASFTRRYLDRISNSVRVIVNAGQNRDRQDRTADGGLLLVENSWITTRPLTFVPYANLFYGWGRPQSVARAAISGGILRNTGINFDTDGLNGFPTLDTSGADTAGGSVGVDLIGADLDRQLLLEFSYLSPHGGRAIAQGDQYAVGARYQFPISHATLLRFDVMHGWRDGQPDVYGTRMEYRWKF